MTTPKIDEWPYFILGPLHRRPVPAEALVLNAVGVSIGKEPSPFGPTHFYLRTAFWRPEGRSFVFYLLSGSNEHEATLNVRRLLALGVS